jgi:hypothetical protein
LNNAETVLLAPLCGLRLLSFKSPAPFVSTDRSLRSRFSSRQNAEGEI